MKTQTLKLKDGRKLIYAEYGRSDALPLIFLHGTPGSHIQTDELIAINDTVDFRMIVPSRPGYSYSDPKPGYTLLDYGDDISELADSLSLEKFGIIGGSGGGPYALACASKIAHRLSVVGIFSSPAPYSEEELKAMPSSADFEAGTRAFVERALSDPEPVINEMIASAAEVDRPLAEQNRSILFATLEEAYRKGIHGAVGDFEARASGWGFALDSIKTRVYLWHGEKDIWVPLAHAHTLVAGIPDCIPTYLPNTGHLLTNEDYTKVFRCLKEVMEMA